MIDSTFFDSITVQRNAMFLNKITLKKLALQAITDFLDFCHFILFREPNF